MLSVIIPSFKDPYLQKTVDSALSASMGDIEVVVVLDGHWPSVPLKADPRVKIVHLGEQGGMRNAINKGVAVSRGEFIARSDEHCMFGEGFDTILTSNMEEDWIVTPRRYFLDPVRWAVMDIPPVDYEKLVIKEKPRKFSGQRWTSRAIARKDFDVDETLAMQGSMWAMPRSLWNTTIKELDSSGYGTHYGDSIEMCFKVWAVGGKLMVNKNTWFAHKHRSFPRTHGYGGQAAWDGWAFALKKHEEEYARIKKTWKI